MPKTYRLYGNLETITKINEINEPNEEKRYLLNILGQELVTKGWNATFTLPGPNRPCIFQLTREALKSMA